MDLSQALAASGFAGLVLVLGLAALCFAGQLVWSVIDCSDSQRKRDEKLLICVAMLCFFPVASTAYALFFGSSRGLRRFTLVSLIVLALLGMAGFAACSLGVVRVSKRAIEESAEESRQQRLAAEKRALAFEPPALAPGAVAPFPALHFVHGEHYPESAALAEFTLGGPDLASATAVSAKIRHVAVGAPGIFALTSHELGQVSPESGEFVEIPLPPELDADFSWPKGLAFDAEPGRLVVMTSAVRFFHYDTHEERWSQLATEHRGLSLIGLAWLPEQALLYALERRGHESQLTALQRFNAFGARVGPLALDPPIPLHPDQPDAIQLLASSGRLVLLLPPVAGVTGGAHAKLFVIDPANGAVSAAPAS